ncbi:GTP cyclohydrolase II [Serendipita sp. 407]|nr:GTP cyclohydrolase II [Serendipita sp. 407]
MSVHMMVQQPLATDMDVLAMLTSPSSSISPPGVKSVMRNGRYNRREAPLDPLLLAAAISSGPHITRHHHHHVHAVPAMEDLFSDKAPEASNVPTSSARGGVADVESSRARYNSQQAPRSQRIKQSSPDSDKENQRGPLSGGNAGNLPSRRPRGSSLLQSHASGAAGPAASGNSTNPPFSSPTAFPSSSFGKGTVSSATVGAGPPPPSPFLFHAVQTTLTKPVIRNLPPAPLQVQCMARTRIPTPYGTAFLHLYRNNKDAKEHLAFVVDHAQLEEGGDVEGGGEGERYFIRSKTLDAKWSEDETELDRLTRGAYVGRLSPTTHRASKPPAPTPTASTSTPPSSQSRPLPSLVRIHSECFTGETIGSMRCDCGEQLDEALRLISLPPSSSSPGRGAVIYLRQEGRGIGLLSKIRAYNLQDMGHDTVQANLLLGHGADERRYDIAAAILQDLGLGEEGEAMGGDHDATRMGIELLTNNPDKVKSLEAEGIKVVKRRAMIPRSWQHLHQQPVAMKADEEQRMQVDEPGAVLSVHGATLIGGGGAAYGVDLEKYLRTKVERMGHMLDLPIPSSSST